MPEALGATDTQCKQEEEECVQQPTQELQGRTIFASRHPNSAEWNGFGASTNPLSNAMCCNLSFATQRSRRDDLFMATKHITILVRVGLGFKVYPKIVACRQRGPEAVVEAGGGGPRGLSRQSGKERLEGRLLRRPRQPGKDPGQAAGLRAEERGAGAAAARQTGGACEPDGGCLPRQQLLQVCCHSAD